MQPLDEVLPQFDAREHHKRHVGLAPESAVAAVLASPAAPDRLTRILFAVRRIGGRDGSVRDLLVALGGREVVRRDGVAAFLRPGRITIAVAFWAERVGSTSILHTETRVRAGDRGARRGFRLYWSLIRPFSGLIRRRWLRAATRG